MSAEPLDVLVVGGGVTGAGAALDSASRGLRTGLVEAQDWGAGTSSRSSKLVHGGLRYLQMLDFGLVREALRERALLLDEIAPHLVRPVRVLYPLRQPFVERAYVGAGIALYDMLGFSARRGRGLPVHRHLSRKGALGLAPALRPAALAGAIAYWDAQVDDARYVTELVRTAAAYGALVANRATVTRLSKQAGRICGAVVRDEETGEEHSITARVTISATGVWSEETEALAGEGRAVRVRPSKGAHILVPRSAIASSVAMILRTGKSVLFVLPWGPHWLIGTTDTDWPYDKARPLATRADVDYLLAELNEVLEVPLGRQDVAGVYAGLRPLVVGSGVVRGPGEARAGQATTKLSREHSVERTAPGLVVVSGGKYTTYRVMAADALDAAVAEGRLHALPCRTASIPLLGAQGYQDAWEARAAAAAAAGVPVAEMERLLHRYGSLSAEVVGACPDGRGGAQLAGGAGYTEAEVRYAVTHEGALHLEDVLARRARVAMEAPDGGTAAAAAAAELMAPLLGWGPAEVEAEVQDYRRQSELAARAAAEAPDDGSAASLASETSHRLALP
jgi:glycerol-3-phosphate dehydrogenase